jgi:REP element-mobilizing transposase RayT
MTRCLHARYLLTPTPGLNDRIVGVLGRASEVFGGVEVHAVVVMSNHVHMLVTSETADHLSAWMTHVNGNIARIAGAEHGWREKFWSDRYHAEACLDRAAVLQQLAYVIRHGCKEKLMKRPEDWPGVNSVDAMRRGRGLVGTWYDESVRNRKRARGQLLHPKDHATTYTVPLTCPDLLRDLGPDGYRAEIERMRREAIAEGEALRAGAAPVGAKRILRQDPFDAPKAPKRGPRARCHAADAEIREAFLESYRLAVAAYREAVERLRAGYAECRFPAGMIPPGTSLGAPRLDTG